MKMPAMVRRRMPTLLVLALVLATAGVLQFTNANPAASQSLMLISRAASSDPGLDPNAAVWNESASIDVPLTAQQQAYPIGGGSIATISAKSLHRDGNLYVRVEWTDATQDDSTLKVENFSDAVALEFPASASATVPSICMGQVGAGVNIWQWRADSQVGHGDPSERYPNLWVERYPGDGPEFYTARAAGNPYALADGGPVQDLVAASFGNIGPAGSQTVQGQGVYQGGKWAVVFARPLNPGDASLTAFHETGTTDLAFAVWDGSQSERNGQKSVSAFVRIHIFPGDAGGSAAPTWLIALGLLVGLSGLGVGLAVIGTRSGAK